MVVDRNYRCSVTKPDDFDDFWDGVLDDVNSIDLDPSMEIDPLRSNDEVDVYQVFYNSLDHVRISAWYSVPKNATGKLPAMIQLPGYQSDPPIAREWAVKGYACISVNPRGKVRSRSQFDPGYPGLLTYGIVDRNSYTYRGFYVDAWRAVDFLLGRTEVDGTRIGAVGGSQGGGLAITIAAMRKEITAASISAPYLCGYMDAIELTHAYPFHEINDYLHTYPERRADVERTIAYFDGISFADKITCPVIVNVGLQDNVVPPETGYAVFNAISSENKKFYEYDGHGHDAGKYIHGAIVDEFFATHLKRGN
ncbi:MAG: prolyl oligopeptidase family serine peptidase [Chloroflexi bacterium]|jgi:cephalosporin-C deacetylase|nr:prolyl oligopeptidase family serine peptidase [Chloroflexota bacterium]